MSPTVSPIRQPSPAPATAPSTLQQVFGGVPSLGHHIADSIIGHRGMRGQSHVGNRPEDFAAAADAGTRWVELDVRRTSDGQLVVVHDGHVGSHIPLLSPWLGGRKVGQLVERDLEADPQDMPAKFDDVLAMLHARGIGVDVHLKEVGYESQVVDAVRRNGMIHAAVFSSFEEQTIRSLEALDHSLVTGLLRWQLPIWDRFERWLRPGTTVDDARAVGADFVAVTDGIAGPRMLARAREAHMPVVVWTVNDAARAATLLRDPNVLGVITDRPGDLLHAAGTGPLAHVRSD